MKARERSEIATEMDSKAAVREEGNEQIHANEKRPSDEKSTRTATLRIMMKARFFSFEKERERE